MKSSSFSWLHLTDLHFGLKGQDTLWPNLRQPLLDDLDELHKKTGPWNAVFFTGDLVQQGKSEEFSLMQKEVLERLWNKLQSLGSGNAVLLAVPGNHDLFRPDPKGDNAAVDRLLEANGFEGISEKFWENPNSPYRRVVNEAFAAYNEWWHPNPYRLQDIVSGIIPGDFSCTLNCGDFKVGVIGLNTAFLQLGNGDYLDKLTWDSRQLSAVCGSIDDWVNQHSVCFLLTHHGPEWLSPKARTHGESEISPAGRFALHLFGHMHENKIVQTSIGGNPNAVRLCQGNSVFGLEKFGDPPSIHRSHGYIAGRIDFRKNGEAILRIWPRVATNKTGPWRFIPDYQNGYLTADQSTLEQKIKIRKNKTSLAPKIEKKQKARFFAPYSTLPSRRPFFGREKELSDIAKYLQPDHKGWGVVLDGPGGMGKTSLALEAAHRAPAEHFPLKLFITAKSSRLDPDGVHQLQDHRVVDYYGLLTEIGLSLGISDIQRVPQEQKADSIRHALAQQRALLILDNLETFSRDERRRIYDLLEVLPSGCRAIVTSRRRDETAARIIRLDKLDFEASCKLLDGLAQQTQRVSRLSEDEKRTLYVESGGNPLLLTWVAAQLGRVRGRCRTVKEAVARLQEAHKRQQDDEKNDPLEFVFGDLLDTFTNAETAVLAALAHFHEPARLAWLLPLCALSETAALTALDDLRDRALLIENQTNDTWFLPPLCAKFLSVRRSEAVKTAGERLKSVAYKFIKELGGASNDKWDELALVWPSVEAALPLFIASENSRLQEVCIALDKFLDFTGRWDQGLTLALEAEIKAVTEEDYETAGWRSYQAGWIYHLLGDAKGVLDSSERCMDFWKRSNVADDLQVAALRLRAIGYQITGDYSAAIKTVQQTLETSLKNDPDSEDVTVYLDTLASFKKLSGDLEGAEVDYSAALSGARRVGTPELTAVVLSNYANLKSQLGEWDSVKGLAEEALNLSKQVGRLDLIAQSHGMLAQSLLAKEHVETALAHAREAMNINAQLESRDSTAIQEILDACEAAFLKIQEEKQEQAE
jgi:tetratricopeptide (TPR) repeat protein